MVALGSTDTGRVQAVDRAAALLEAVAAGSPRGRTLADLAAECGLNRSTAWRLIATLEHHGLVERDSDANTYAIGLAVSRMAATAGVAGLVRRSHGVLVEICAETGETANLAVPQRLGLTYVDEATPQSILAARWLGTHVPAHATSAGKAFLAWLPPGEAESILAAPLAEYTDSTRTDHDELRAELDRIRSDGYAASDGELEADVNGVSVPVLDAGGHPYAVISVWGPRTRVPPKRFPELGALLVAAAARI